MLYSQFENVFLHIFRFPLVLVLLHHHLLGLCVCVCVIIFIIFQCDLFIVAFSILIYDGFFFLFLCFSFR